MIAVRIEGVTKKEYEYFLKGNFSLGDVEKPGKNIGGLNTEASTSLYNMKKVFDNNIYDILLKGG